MTSEIKQIQGNLDTKKIQRSLHLYLKLLVSVKQVCIYKFAIKESCIFLRNGCFNAVQDYPGMVSTMEINRLWNLSGATDLWSVRS